MSPASSPQAKTPPTFVEVKSILDWLVKGKEDRLNDFHGDSFGWATKEQLAAAAVEPGDGNVYRLIDPALVGNGRGKDTLLIKALTTGAAGFPRMPYDGNDEGQYATSQQLATIVAWIDAGMPA